MKSLPSNSAHYNLVLFVIVLCLPNSLAIAFTEDAKKLNGLKVDSTAAYSQLQPTFSRSLAQASTKSSPQKPSIPATSSEPEPLVLVSEVVIKGVAGKLENEAYKAIINTRPQRTTTRSGLQKDINAIFATGWFSNVEALPEDTVLGVRVTFKVKPNPVLSLVQIPGHSVLPQQVIDNIFQKQYGSTLNLVQLQKGIQQINQWYQDNGYTAADINDHKKVDENGLVTLQVSEGIINEVAINGIEGKLKDVIYGAIKTRPGTIYNEYQVLTDTDIINSYGTVLKWKYVSKDARLTFDLKPNPVLHSVKVSGNQGVFQNVVDNIFSEQYGNILNWTSLQKGIERLNQWYQESNSSLAHIEKIPPEPKVTEDGTVELAVSEGEIEDIQIQFIGKNGEVRDTKGQPISGKTPIQKILQEMRSEPGQAFKRDILASDLQRIFGLGIFQDVRVSLDYKKESNQVVINVDVIEKPDGKSLDEVGVTAVSRQQAIVADVTMELGSIYLDSKEYQKAQSKFQEALQIYRATKEQERQIKALNKIGLVNAEKKEYPEAIAQYQEALQISESIGNILWQASVLKNLSKSHEELGELYKRRENFSGFRKEYELAIESCQKSLSLFKTLKTISPKVEAIVFLNSLGLLYKNLGEFQQAHDTFQQTLRLLYMAEKPSIQVAYPYDLFDDFGANNVDRNYLKGFVLLNLGETYIRSGNYQQGLYALHTSLSLLQISIQTHERKESSKASDEKSFEVNEMLIASSIDRILSNIYSKLNETQQAQKYLKETLQDLTSKIGENDLENLISKLESSIFSADEALQLTFKIGGNNSEGFQFSVDTDSVAVDGVEGIKQKRQFFEAFGTEGEALWRIAIAEEIAKSEELNDKQQALELYNQAISGIAEDNVQRADTLNSIGNVLVDMGKAQDGIISYKQALKLWQKSKLQFREASTLSLIGDALSKLKQYEQALGFYNKALRIQQKLRDSSGAADTHYGLALLNRSQGNFTQARNEIEVAIKTSPTETGSGLHYSTDLPENLPLISGQSKSTIRTEITKSEPIEIKPKDYESYTKLASYNSHRQKYYEFYIDLLMQQHQQHPNWGYDIKALLVSEHSRNFALQTFLNAAKNSNGTQAQNSSAQSSVVLNQPMKLAEIPKLLDENTLLLEYSLGNEHSYLWVVSRDRSSVIKIKSYVLPRRKEIEHVAQQFYDFLTVPSLRIRPNKTARAGLELSRMILVPANKQLKQQRLLVVGDGILEYIPFSALPIATSEGIASHDNLTTSTQPLLVNHEVVNLPSASVLDIIRQRQVNHKPAPRQLAVFADPVFNLDDQRLVKKPDRVNSQFQPFSWIFTASSGTIPTNNLSDIVQIYPRLEGFRRTAERILALVPKSERRELFDFDASLQNATSSELQQYRIVHFETHGVFDNQNPERSGVILSTVNQDSELQMGLLSPNIIFNMQLPADLIVLSGCRTGLGKQINGEGLTGLTSSFMYAGAARVVVSLWSVEDQATSELMTRFYKAMLQDKLPAAQALRKAQLSMLQDPQWQLPYYWAAFTLQGEWN